MIYPIYVYGSPVLRKRAEEITPDYPELDKLVADMTETLLASEGVGLAAPQIGKSIRLFIVDLSLYGGDEPGVAGFKRVFINPEIYDYSEDEILIEEGCLSVPGLHEEVWRPETVRIRYFDEKFVEHDEEFTGYIARVVQHEFDHLEGEVFTDHLSTIRKTLLKSKLNAMSKGKFTASYKTKQIK